MAGDDGRMGLLQVVSIAVGTMIGASIFSIFGLGARIAGHNLPLVFVISGLVALLVAYSYAVLGARIVSNAGPMEFILRGFGDSLLTGALSFLFWMSYVVSLSLFAKGFAGYFLPLFSIPDGPLATAAVEVGVVLLFTALNLRGARGVGRAEFVIVLVKLGILGLFVVLGLSSVRPEWITPAVDAPAMRDMFYATAVFFLSYMGFGLVTNASENMRDPERNVPRAIYLSILVVSLVYVSVAVVAVGNLPLPALIQAQDFALAEAARPFLGSWGYTLVSVGALFSIASALNATLYGGANIAYALARDGELPELFRRKTWFQAPEGLYITAGLSIGFALLFNLNGIASLTSAVFMVIYLFVLAAHYRLSREYGGSRPLILFALLVVAGVFLVLMAYLWQTGRGSFWACWATFGGSLLLELVYRGITGRILLERDFAAIERRLAGRIAQRSKRT
ncbi:APC family permease [Thiohalobacter sp. IOR34]|uniref:APC family permease n=1 Tax=Thiohalobacter sp. IOR34 TaxID=3057176 RepID=UPI0025AF62D6|nr:APC family permease [Thiohalobacter sp. IOR34]WJW76349.1 APC family permease [Thiohalobacter sp. IOR34]